jgi:hypothetical protein
VVTKRRDGDGRPVRHSFGGGGYGEKQIGKLEKKARPNRYAKRCGRGNEGHEEETKFGIRSRLEGEITVLKFIFVAFATFCSIRPFFSPSLPHNRWVVGAFGVSHLAQRKSKFEKPPRPLQPPRDTSALFLFLSRQRFRQSEQKRAGVQRRGL